ncbi:MAG TPA: beta-L-arabinofuranosidase domain-containing protein, partial [Phycisphaerales bacterium]|nr:beta-L-arabinofuranosidase domain-containing protein [Phycisphaerales bacterium]
MHTLALSLALLLTAGSPAALAQQPAAPQAATQPPSPAQHTGLTSIPLRSIELSGGFWKTRQDTNAARTVWANIEQCEKTGRIANFDEAAKYIKGDKSAQNRGLLFNDSDVYKVLEGAAYILASRPGDEDSKKLRATCDDIIRRIAAAQHDDGYINTYHTVKAPEKRWKVVEHNHELYCGGHLIEAGVAYAQATGDKTLLNVGIRFANHVDSLFGPSKRHAVPGHQEIELALIKLWRFTGETRYLNLARYFIDARGHTQGRPTTGEYSQDHLPVREQDHIVGHAVRGMYMFMAVADLLDIPAYANDEGYIQATDDVWHDLTHRKTYVTGGIGPSAHNEGFTTPYDLPNDTAYAETCAGIGSVLWNERLGRLYADAAYFDAAERALYNGVLSGVSLSGDRFFYVNPLLARGNHDRPDWYECACCPPNILRTVANVGTLFYSTRTSGQTSPATSAIYTNLYNTSIARFDDAGMIIHQKTDYPWSGEVQMSISSSRPDASSASMPVELLARVPSWCRSATFTINGKTIKPEISKGYARLGSRWKAGDTITLNFDMPVERIQANPMVQADLGRVALQRGPVVYCLESPDNAGDVLSVSLPPDAPLSAEFRPDLLSGVGIIKGEGLSLNQQPKVWRSELYRPVPTVQRAPFTAIPYFAWNNRGRTSMTVWLPESLGMLGGTSVGQHTYTSSFRFRDEIPDNVADGAAPANSGDY